MAGKPLRNKPRRAKKRAAAGRATADKVLAQGVGKSVNKAFGGNGKSSPSKGISYLPRGAWDAFHTAHAPLPRSVGAYTVVRTTEFVNTTSNAIMVGTFQQLNFTDGDRYWKPTVVAMSTGNTALPLGANPTTEFWSTPVPGARTGQDSTFTCCPSAISVQVMCNEPISTAAGQIAAAVIPVRMDLTNDTRSWDTIRQEFVSYFRPRLLSAGKLALRGVQMDSHPLSMADVSEFLPMGSTPATAAANWSTGQDLHPRGWAPMFINNPTNANLTLLITVEWRVRFDIGNPAVASHTHHGVSDDYAWDRHIQAATRALPGVIDIVEKVANTGLGVYRAYQGAAALAI